MCMALLKAATPAPIHMLKDSGGSLLGCSSFFRLHCSRFPSLVGQHSVLVATPVRIAPHAHTHSLDLERFMQASNNTPA